MEWTLDSVVGWWERVYQRTLEVAQAVPQEFLNWRPREGEFSPADIIQHIASTQLMNVGRLESGRLVYPGHGAVENQTKTEVIAYLESCHLTARQLLQQYGEAGLTRLIPTNQGQIEGWRVVVGMIEHEIHHRSQLCSYLTQLGLSPPALFGLYVEELPTE